MFTKIIKNIKAWNRRRLARRTSHCLPVLMPRVERIEQELHALAQAFADQRGLSMAKLRMELLHVPPKYEYMICNVPSGALVIDGGANLGLFSDLMLGLGARVEAFEPNPVLCESLSKKYAHLDPSVFTLNRKAISVCEKELTFSMAKGVGFINASQGGSLDVDPGIERLDFKVQTMDFPAYLQALKDQGIRPYLIKLDIEGSEFDVLEKLINADLCDAFDFMVCETHERFFMNGEDRLRQLKKSLIDKNIRNVFLDWF